MSIRPRPSDPLTNPPAVASRHGSSTILMSPHQLLAGIAFHLIDSGQAGSVEEHARLKTLGRLKRHGFKASLPRRLAGHGEREHWTGCWRGQRHDVHVDVGSRGDPKAPEACRSGTP